MEASRWKCDRTHTSHCTLRVINLLRDSLLCVDNALGRSNLFNHVLIPLYIDTLPFISKRYYGNYDLLFTPIISINLRCDRPWGNQIIIPPPLYKKPRFFQRSGRSLRLCIWNGRRQLRPTHYCHLYHRSQFFTDLLSLRLFSSRSWSWVLSLLFFLIVFYRKVLFFF